MSWAGKQHPVEAAVEWLAPIPLAVAVGWAGGRLGQSPIEAMALGALALVLGFSAIRLVGGPCAAQLRSFEPAEFASVELDELVLDECDSVLELDDPLEAPNSDSRVVRLFERPEPTPGELVDRIAYFLGEAGRAAPSEVQSADIGPAPDASAALHHALANIRASLR